MPCYYPMQAYQLPAEKTVSKQKSVISFRARLALVGNLFHCLVGSV